MKEVLIIYGILAFYFCMYQLAVYHSARNNSRQLQDILTGRGEPGVLLARLIAGIFFLGMAVVHVAGIRESETAFLNIPDEVKTLTLFLIALITVFAGGLITGYRMQFGSSSSNSLNHLPLFYPQGFVILRTVFLVVYEFFFRGILLFVLLESTGVIAAFSINTFLYVINHWYDKKERYGSIIAGVILCWITVFYQSVWPAVIIHLFMALSAEIVQLGRFKSTLKTSGI